MGLMEKIASYLIKPGVVEYIDLVEHSDCTREEFFTEKDVATLRVYGLIHETDDLVRVLFYDDITDNTECQGIVIPASCVVSIIYFVSEKEAQLHSKDPAVN